jgi:hypothetical protein
MNRNYEEYTNSFEQLDIDAETFSHRDHVGVAHELLRKYDFWTAAIKFSTCLNTIATRAGAADKFNMTITMAFLSIIAERIDAAEDARFDDFINANQDLLSSDILTSRYSRERLGSEKAKTMFLMPDMPGTLGS